jgi:hypothetical protein
VIPETLDAWTLNVTRSLVEQGVFETDRFDFKEMLPHPKDDEGKRRLRRDVAAFANSAGGFLVFGVKNDKGLPAEDRIVGLPATHDFPEQFGNYPSACEPSVEWAFKNNPPIGLGGDRVIHVIHIAPSPRRPHAVIEDQRWWFCRRTNKGTEPMTYEEIRLAFQDTENRRTKLALLSSELSHIGFIAERLLKELPEEGHPGGQSGQLVNDWAWTTRYPTIVVDTLLGDAFAIVARNADLWVALSTLRDNLRRSNAIAEAYSNYAFIRSTADPQQRTKLYKEMRLLAGSIFGEVGQAKTLVDDALAGRS